MPTDITPIKTANENSASHNLGLRGSRGVEFFFELIFFLLDNVIDRGFPKTEVLRKQPPAVI
jgi:hypothetical protein